MTDSFPDPCAPRAAIALLRSEAPDGFWRLCVFILVAAFGNVLLLIALAQVVAEGPGGSVGQYALLYVLAFALFLYAQRTAATEIAVMGEEAMAALRLRLATGLLSRDPSLRARAVRVGASGRLLAAAATLSQDLPYVAAAAQALATAALALAFIGVLSPPAFGLALLGLGLGALFLRGRRRQAQAVHLQAQQQESATLRALSKLAEPPDDPEARLALFETTLETLEAEAAVKADLGRRRFEAGAFAAMGALAAAPLAAFVLPHATEVGAARVLIAFLFLAAPLVLLVDALPILARLEATAQELTAIAGELDEEDVGERSSHDRIGP